jgi:hypothetical protein
VKYFIIGHARNAQKAECGITTLKGNRIVGTRYKIQSMEGHVETYSIRFPEVEQWYSGSIKDLVVLPSSKEIVNKMFPAILPEMIGATVGGILALSGSVYLFLTGLIGAGFALLGPSLAGIFGAIVLWHLTEKLESK